MTALPVVPIAVVGAVVLVLLFALGVVLSLRSRDRRRRGWADLAARRGLQYALGDPLGLTGAGVGRVEITLHPAAGASPRLALVGVMHAGTATAATEPAVVLWGNDLDLAGLAWNTRWRRVDHPQYGPLVVVDGPARFRGDGATAPAPEAERLLDDVLRRLPR
jgi:hypothetical protein